MKRSIPPAEKIGLLAQNFAGHGKQCCGTLLNRVNKAPGVLGLCPPERKILGREPA